MARKKLSEDEIKSALGDLKDWKIEDVNLEKRFEFANFTAALSFVNQVGAIAEQRDHHPDIRFGWGYAEFSVTTHDAGGLTQNDFELAKEIENLQSGDLSGSSVFSHRSKMPDG
ncbi:MAG: 4a-hydroxytetrahydrobiopterin dehydratase [Pyrinomonadaceae bacterium]|nr:4a-hydroxytetrahydrobiopterin dehydratase [Pyrinomonadaceae bacterium]